jgi:hypothetical protein
MIEETSTAAAPPYHDGRLALTPRESHGLDGKRQEIAAKRQIEQRGRTLVAP